MSDMFDKSQMSETIDVPAGCDCSNFVVSYFVGTVTIVIL